MDQNLNKMIWGYPSHTFVIDCKEAQELGLNARLLNDKEIVIVDKMLEYLHTQSFECIGFIKDDIIKEEKKDEANLGVEPTQTTAERV